MYVRSVSASIYPSFYTLRSTRDQAFEEFAQEYAKIEDEIRGIWTKIVKAHEPTIV